jgi:hypothetical protein
MMRKIIFIILIIISLLLGTLLISEKIKNKRLTEKIEGLSDRLGEIKYGEREFGD